MLYPTVKSGPGASFLSLWSEDRAENIITIYSIMVNVSTKSWQFAYKRMSAFFIVFLDIEQIWVKYLLLFRHSLVFLTWKEHLKHMDSYFFIVSWFLLYYRMFWVCLALCVVPEWNKKKKLWPVIRQQWPWWKWCLYVL